MPQRCPVYPRVLGIFFFAHFLPCKSCTKPNPPGNVTRCCDSNIPHHAAMGYLWRTRRGCDRKFSSLGGQQNIRTALHLCAGIYFSRFFVRDGQFQSLGYNTAAITLTVPPTQFIHAKAFLVQSKLSQNNI